jgi:ribosomal protein S18 acetylase RimI-like enzyme
MDLARWEGCYDADGFEAPMQTPIDVTAAAPDDYAWCAGLMATSEPWITLGRDLGSCRDALTRPGADLFIARKAEDDLPAGFVLLAPYGLAGSPYIAAIAVAAKMRGQGIGSELLRFAERRFVRRAHLFLLVSSFNHKARQLYLRQGYEYVGELKDYCIAGQSELILHKGLK